MTGAATLGALLALAASPMHVVVRPGETTTVTVRNLGAAAETIAAAPIAYRLDPRGRPLLGTITSSWLTARPARLSLAPGATGRLSVRASAPRGARAGDHARALLLAAQPQSPHGLRLSVRVGVVIVVRCPGRLRRALVPGALHVLRLRRARVLRLVVRNDGNVDEWIARRAVRVRLVRSGRSTAELQARPRRLLAGTTGVFEWRLPPNVQGDVRAVALVGPHTVRRYRLRL